MYTFSCDIEEMNSNNPMVVAVETGGDSIGVWSDNTESKFVMLMDEEVDKGNKLGSTFSKAGWSNILTKLNALTRTKFNREQLRNKFYQLKMRHNAFDALLETETELGWDPLLGNLSATNEIWDRICQANKYARRFRKKGLPHYHILSKVFGDTQVDGARALPLNRVALDTDNEEQGDISINLRSVDKTQQSQHDDVESNTTTRRVSPSTPDGTRHHLGKRDSLTAALSSCVALLTQTQKRKLELLDKKMLEFSSSAGVGSILHGVSEVCECMQALNGLEGVDGASYAKAVERFHSDALWRVMFRQMPDDRKRDWVLNLP